MAQFKFIGNSNGAFPEYEAGTTVTVKGNCKIGSTETFEIEVEPNEVFDIPGDWATAIVSLEALVRNDQPVYERVA
jgi:hypothetical protein